MSLSLNNHSLMNSTRMSIEPNEECNFQQCQNDPYSPSSSNISRVHKYHYKLFYFIIRTIVKKKVKAELF